MVELALLYAVCGYYHVLWVPIVCALLNVSVFAYKGKWDSWLGVVIVFITVWVSFLIGWLI